MTRRTGIYEELPHGRLPGQGIVPKEAYPDYYGPRIRELSDLLGV